LEAARALGIEVRRFRERTPALEAALRGHPGRQAVLLLGPSHPVSAPERVRFAALNRTVDLVLAGESAEPVMRCFGYRVRREPFDRFPALGAPEGAGVPPGVRAVLVPTGQQIAVDSSRRFDVGENSCTVPPFRAVDTLLRREDGAPVALGLARADLDRRVVLLADEELVRNRALRRTAAGPVILEQLAGRYDRLVFEEYHHGFGAQGSLGSAALAWSLRSPWGWLVWQLAAVGVLALLAGAVRFGPARSGIIRRRRSPLEHVRALATALAAARGHDEAIGAIVRGLRRRLGGSRAAAEPDGRAWLASLKGTLTSPRAQAALQGLSALTSPGQPAASVLRAAYLAEDLWEELRPSARPS
jgi:hypothetical protein